MLDITENILSFDAIVVSATHNLVEREQSRPLEGRKLRSQRLRPSPFGIGRPVAGCRARTKQRSPTRVARLLNAGVNLRGLVFARSPNTLGLAPLLQMVRQANPSFTAFSWSEGRREGMMDGLDCLTLQPGSSPPFKLK